jgi:hypothetical protein
VLAVKTLRILAISSLVGLLPACSNTFLYNQLDWLIPWYVDGYVDLTRDQRQTLKPRLNDLLRWHRSEELASYVAILDRIEADLAATVTAADVEHWANLTYAAYERIEARMLPLAFELGRDLSDRQMSEFMERLFDEQLELEEEYLERSDAEYVDDTRKRFRENLSDFLGRLTPEQSAVIDRSAASLQRFDQAWLTERARWLSTLSSLLERQPGWEDAVLKAIEERERNRTESYRSAYAHNAVIVNGTIAEVLNLRTEKQDQRLLREIGDLRRDLNKLISQGDVD